MSGFFESAFHFISSNTLLSVFIFGMLGFLIWIVCNYLLAYLKLFKLIGMLAAFVLLTLLFLLMDDEDVANTEAQQRVENKKKNERIKKDIADKDKGSSVKVDLLEDILKDFKCRYFKTMRMKSMQQGFFIPFEKSFDLLMLNQGPSEFIVYLRSREDDKVIKTLFLGLKKPIIITLVGKQYQIFYEETDGFARVVSVTPCYCLKNKK